MKSVYKQDNFVEQKFEKIFGEKGREFGKVIDKLTDNIEIILKDGKYKK